MRRAILVSSTFVFSSATYAQTGLTFYGRLDAGFEYVTGVPGGASPGESATRSSNRLRAESGNWGASVWGLKGAEDLGGGVKAQFKLEGGFNTMTGTGPGDNGIFNRLATVGLSSANSGTVLAGRQFFISNGIWDFDPLGQTAWSSASLVRGRNWPFTSNSISYQSPTLAGFDLYGQYSLSNATNWNGNGTTPQGRQAGVQVTYTSSIFQIRGIYDEIRNASNGTLYGHPQDSVNGENVSGGIFEASREYTVAVNLFLDPFKIQAGYQAIRSSGAANVPPAQPTTLDHQWGGVTWNPTPATALMAAIYHVNGNNGAGNATLYTLGSSYRLSKRTTLNMQIATTRNSKVANYGLAPNNPGTAVATGNPLPGHSQSGVYAGMQHSF